MNVAVVDYGMGNLHSVRHALSMIGADVIVADTPEALRSADRIVLPGVGAFGECLANLKKSGMLETLDEQVRSRARPMLGICLGMQVLATSGEEMGEHEGLGWIPGRIRHLEVDRDARGLRVPHVGWNEVHLKPIEPTGKPHPVLDGIRPNTTFYFVHSYFFEPLDAAHAVATCNYGVDFTCAVAKDTIIATQFHPEKSQQNGLAILERFLDWSP